MLIECRKLFFLCCCCCCCCCGGGGGGGGVCHTLFEATSETSHVSEIHVKKVVAVVSRFRRIVEAHGKVEKERVEQSLEAAKAEAEFRFWDLAMQLDKRGPCVWSCIRI